MSTMEGLMTVADEESQRANEWTGLQDDIQVVRVEVERERAALIPSSRSSNKDVPYLPT